MKIKTQMDSQGGAGEIWGFSKLSEGGGNSGSGLDNGRSGNRQSLHKQRLWRGLNQMVQRPSGPDYSGSWCSKVRCWFC
jgi:hypothetical protein